MRSALHYPASTSTSSADFGEHHRPMRLDGANLDRNGTVRCSAVFFFRPDCTTYLHFAF
jgi:hypothetical protein